MFNSCTHLHRLALGDAETENRLLIFLGKRPTTTPASVFRTRTHCLDCVNKLTLLPPPVTKTPWRHDILVRSCGWWTPCRRLHWRAQLQTYCTRGSYDCEYWWQHTVKFWRMKYWRIALKTANPPKYIPRQTFRPCSMSQLRCLACVFEKPCLNLFYIVFYPLVCMVSL